MITSKDIRLKNARTLLAEAGSRKAMAKRLDKSEGQIGHIMGPNPIKGIGNKIAREIEIAFDKPEGWLDVDHEFIEEVSRSNIQLQQDGDSVNVYLDPLDSPLFGSRPPGYDGLPDYKKEAVDYIIDLSQEEAEEILPILRRYRAKGK